MTTFYYAGSLSSSKRKRLPEIARAFQSWVDQKSRCNNPKTKCFHLYGAKGIKVEYSSREFVGWWVYQQKRLKLKNPTVGRIDHNKGYNFKNIKLEEHLTNSADGRVRANIARRSKIILLKNGKILRRFKSVAEASYKLGVSLRTIENQAMGRQVTFRKYPGCVLQYGET